MKSVRKSISRRASKTGLMSSREKANKAAMGASTEGTDAPDDLSQLLRLEESEILRCLKARHFDKRMYSSVNTLLVSVNPCELIAGMYGEEMVHRYLDGEEHKPHVYLTAAHAHVGMQHGHCQSIVITGESGAGKTENFKKVIQFCSFACHQGGSDGAGALETSLMEAGEALESFGNGFTTRNPNSSRFGKWVQLHFSREEVLLAVSLKIYLLERTRVVGCNQGERGFHVFYELLGGGEPNLLQECFLDPPPDTRFLPAHSFGVDARRDDAKSFVQLRSSLAASDIPRYDQDQLFCAVASVLQLGALRFDQHERDGGDGAHDLQTIVTPETDTYLQHAAALLGMKPADLSFALCYKQVRTGREWIDSPNAPDTCLTLCESLAKAIYAKCLDWVVAMMNSHLADIGPRHAHSDDAKPNDILVKAPLFIGVLDIFGFEDFAHNSLEQVVHPLPSSVHSCVRLPSRPPVRRARPRPATPSSHVAASFPACRVAPRREQLLINYTNEKLQGIFNHIVVLEQNQIYQEEGLDVPPLDIAGIDNAGCRDVLDKNEPGKGNASSGAFGLLPMLELECQVIIPLSFSIPALNAPRAARSCRAFGAIRFHSSYVVGTPPPALTPTHHPSHGLAVSSDGCAQVPKGTDKALLDKFFDGANNMLGGKLFHKMLRRPKSLEMGFTLAHFASEVTCESKPPLHHSRTTLAFLDGPSFSMHPSMRPSSTALRHLILSLCRRLRPGDLRHGGVLRQEQGSLPRGRAGAAAEVVQPIHQDDLRVDGAAAGGTLA